MLEKILMTVGLAKGPSPIRKFIGATAFFGTIPALGYLAWKYRGKIKSLFANNPGESAGELTAHGERGDLMNAPAY
jgi:hypothetical protein